MPALCLLFGQAMVNRIVVELTAGLLAIVIFRPGDESATFVGEHDEGIRSGSQFKPFAVGVPREVRRIF